jgi:hypothetical protein
MRLAAAIFHRVNGRSGNRNFWLRAETFWDRRDLRGYGFGNPFFNLFKAPDQTANRFQQRTRSPHAERANVFSERTYLFAKLLDSRAESFSYEGLLRVSLAISLRCHCKSPWKSAISGALPKSSGRLSWQSARCVSKNICGHDIRPGNR